MYAVRALCINTTHDAYLSCLWTAQHLLLQKQQCLPLRGCCSTRGRTLMQQHHTSELLSDTFFSPTTPLREGLAPSPWVGGHVPARFSSWLCHRFPSPRSPSPVLSSETVGSISPPPRHESIIFHHRSLQSGGSCAAVISKVGVILPVMFMLYPSSTKVSPRGWPFNEVLGVRSTVVP